MKYASLALALAVFSSGAIAAPAAKADAATGKASVAMDAAQAGGKVKCTRERVTGSNRSIRVCLTEEQARTLTEEQKIDLIRSQHANANAGGGG